MTTKQLLLLNRSEVRSTLDWPSVMDACRSALIDVASSNPLPAISAQLPVPGASLHLKAGAVHTPPTISVKANLRPDGGAADGLILAFDYVEERVVAVLASTDLTAMRTAAIAAIAFEQLNRVPNPKVAIVGAGPLARYFVDILEALGGASELRVWSRSAERAAELAQGRGRSSTSVAEVTEGADVILTCTPARTPLIDASAISADVLILAMGADSPGKRELGPDILETAAVYVDVLEGALAVGELAHVSQAVRDRAVPLGIRLSDPEAHPLPSGRIVFDSVGSSTVDAAVVARSLERAVELGLGTPFAFGA